MTTAANGEQAVSKATSANFDVIILDLAMPKLDGISVIRALRANQSTANVPIFALSAFADEKSRAVVVAAGGDLALDGISVIRALRANQSTANVPIFALSAFADEKSRAVVVAAGGDLALDKPCLPVDLEVVVGVLVARGKRIRSSA